MSIGLLMRFMVCDTSTQNYRGAKKKFCIQKVYFKNLLSSLILEYALKFNLKQIGVFKGQSDNILKTKYIFTLKKVLYFYTNIDKL